MGLLGLKPVAGDSNDTEFMQGADAEIANSRVVSN